MTHLEMELDKVKAMIYEMSDLAIEQINSVIEALKDQNSNAAERIIKKDEALDQLELAIDDTCIKVLVTQQPAAIDLRMVLAFIKMNTDVERIGDLTTSIAKEVIRIGKTPLIKPLLDLPRMGETAVEMIKLTLEAMTEKDVEKAEKVIDMDNIIDELNHQIYRELFSFSIEEPSAISQSMSLIMISRSLERIGDHASNMAERVIYYVEGVDVRHGGIE
jgi:phosphate transport system protein